MKRKAHHCCLLFLLTALTWGAVQGQYGTLYYDGFERTYILHCPPSYDGSSAVPLIIGLHGGGSSGSSFESITEWSLKTDLEGCIAVYPFGVNGGWNYGGFYDSNIDDVGFISTLIDTLSSEYALDLRRIYVTGFSAGALMSYRLAAELSEKIAAIAPVAGQMVLEEINPSRPVPIIHFQDVDDPRVPFEGDDDFPSVASVINTWIEINGCDPDPDTIYNQNGILGTKWSAISTRADIILFTLTRGGHYWPKRDIYANDFMWDFFIAHPIMTDAPSPYFQAERRTGHAPLDVQFTDMTVTLHPLRAWTWDFDHDNITDSNEQYPFWTYEEPGTYTVSLEVSSDALSGTVTRQRYIQVFNGESAVLFNGVNSYVSCSSSQHLNLTDNFSLEAWIYPTGWGEFPTIGFARVIEKGTISVCLVDSFPPCHNHSLLLILMHEDGVMSYSNAPQGSIVLNQWQHIAVTYNGYDCVTIYRNGLEQDVTYPVPPTGAIKENTDVDLYIGNSPDLGGSFEGHIDEIRIWNHERTQEDIQKNTNHRLCGSESGLVGYWNMDEGNGERVSDNSLHGNDGTAVNVTWSEGIHHESPRDSDGDEIFDCSDNCPQDFNTDQGDEDEDGAGDVCDNCPELMNPDQTDRDTDGTGDACDSCTDTDGDGYGDPDYAANTCDEDNCPHVSNQDQAPVERGDIDCIDGVDVLDVLSVVNHILGNTPLIGSPIDRADCTGDGQVDITDVVGIVNVILGTGTCAP
ncbi:MAG: hypothetical protein JSV84_12240 [Gemmatimonadota bacterium]|nr:MAG: hypothetical protein JSV84_12240 [Gemmatimonadota bacterium]